MAMRYAGASLCSHLDPPALWFVSQECDNRGDAGHNMGEGVAPARLKQMPKYVHFGGKNTQKNVQNLRVKRAKTTKMQNFPKNEKMALNLQKKWNCEENSNFKENLKIFEKMLKWLKMRKIG